MKGIIDYYGGQDVGVLLINDAGHSERQVKRANEYITRYGMQKYPRVRMEYEESRRLMLETFGQFNWGYIVIDSEGILRGVNIGGGNRLDHLLSKVLGPGPSSRPGCAVSTSLVERKGGSLFSPSGKTTKSITAKIKVTLTAPEGWTVGGGADSNPLPTRLSVKHTTGPVAGAPAVPAGKVGSDGASWLPSPVEITVPVEVPIGTPIGKHLVHGTLRYVAHDGTRQMPATELTWRVIVDVR